jgi:hypothetical protein
MEELAYSDYSNTHKDNCHDAGTVTGDPKDSLMYTVELETGKTPDIHFRRLVTDGTCELE